MLKIHKEAILKTRSNIVDTIKLDGLFWDLLTEKGVFKPIMMDFIQRRTTREERNRKLVDDIVRRGPETYGPFLDCLREGGYAQLADNIVRNEHTSSPNLAVPEVVSSDDAEDLWQNNKIVLPGRGLSFGPAAVERVEQYHAEGTIGQFREPYEQEKMKYRMESQPRGYALIINNSQFDDPNKNRQVSDIDRDRLEDMFIYLGFTIHNAEDLTAEEMKDEIKLFARKRELEQVDSIAVAVLSHGTDSGRIHGTDGACISESDIIEALNVENCPSMANKPKLVILNACRGVTKDQSVPRNEPLASGCDGNVEPKDDRIGEGVTTPTGDRKVNYQDFITAYSTYHGHVSYRWSDNGSDFIRILNEVFKAKAHQEHIETLLREVRRRVVEHCKESAPFIQLPETRQTLINSWYLHPPHPPN